MRTAHAQKCLRRLQCEFAYVLQYTANSEGPDCAHAEADLSLRSSHMSLKCTCSGSTCYKSKENTVCFHVLIRFGQRAKIKYQKPVVIALCFVCFVMIHVLTLRCIGDRVSLVLQLISTKRLFRAENEIWTYIDLN